MPISDDTHILQGCEILDDRGIESEGVQVRCRSCDSVRLLNEENKAGHYLDRWLCISCRNNLLVYEDGSMRQPAGYLSLPAAFHRAVELPGFDDVRLLHVTPEEFDEDNINRPTKAFWFANRVAKKGDYAIGGVNLGVHGALLVLDGYEVVGYLAYAPPRDSSKLVLRQLYLSESHRQQGIGSAVVEYWWENVASESYDVDGEEDHYYVESPNKNMIRLIISIGHGEDGDGPNAMAI